MPKSSTGRIVGLAVIGLLVALVAFAFVFDRSGSTTSPGPAQQTPNISLETPGTSLTESIPQESRGTTITAVASDVSLSPQARLLAERFQCVCGCKDILATCNCSETPGSRDMKEYLQELVDEGKAPPEIQSAMLARYGSEVLP